MKENFETCNKIKKSTVFKMAFVFSLLLIPQFLFIAIMYLNESFSEYGKHYQVLESYFEDYFLPSHLLILLAAWVSTAVSFVAVIFIIFMRKILNRKISKKYKHIIIFALASIIVISFIINSISEYNYSRFHQMYSYLSNSDLDIKNKELKDLVDVFKTNYKNNIIFGWTSDTMTWWLCLVKVIISIIYFSFLSNSLEHKKINKEYTKKNFEQEKISNILSNLSLNNKKNISLWILLSAIAVFIPHFIYVISISLHDTSLNSMLNWTFNGLQLLNKTTAFQSSSQFAIKSLPIVISGFMIATMSVISVIYIKKEEINYRFLLIQFIILFIEVILLISINTYSMHKLNEIYNYWKENDYSKMVSSNSYLSNILGDSFLNEDGSVKDFFLYGIKYVSHAIITFGLFITSYIIIGTKLLKNFKKSNKINNI
ncbi:hypothetical protein SLITO_v1c10610 [Spiroplasma litorale]|uniref:Transmembrane protein n=1 Tax=Spiroplasma litorale TaxID=216942 RepID=A0A0K1W3I7_9MOLU|nr:hypothetical protein [Spiroplasma litorale]AKX34672.1 hypothetical protein SLITO_v1c10610 [Spiroplasma litorale]